MPVADDYVPTPESDYLVPLGMKLGRQQLNGILGTIGRRIRELEAKRADYDAAIVALNTRALEAIRTNLTAEIQAFRTMRDDATSQMQALREAYALLQQGQIYAEGIRLRDPIKDIGGGSLQTVLTAIGNSLSAVKSESASTKAALDSQRRINPASYYLGSI